jgi:hypothetical protein
MTGKKSNKKFLARVCGSFIAISSFLPAFADDSLDVPMHLQFDQKENQQNMLTESTTAESISPPNSTLTPTPAMNVPVVDAPAANVPAANVPAVNAPATIGPQHRPILEKAALFTPGVIVNTPKAIVRNSKTEIVGDMKELIGESKKPVLVGAAGVLSVPFGVTSGICEGVCFGLVNSWKHGIVHGKDQTGPPP